MSDSDEITPNTGAIVRGRDRSLLPGQRSELRIFDLALGESRLVAAFDFLVEAPNWSPDGKWLVVNAEGRIHRIAIDGRGGLQTIETLGVDGLNNDHLISPDGATLYLTSRDGHLYAAPFVGGTARRISNDHNDRPYRYYLHGISPNGQTLAYVGLEPETNAFPCLRNIFTLPAAGGPETQMTYSQKPADGPEFSPCGRWLYFNTEELSDTPGHAQIVRMPSGGGRLEKLTVDERVNWFPHPAPDGSAILYLSYPPGTEEHPANLWVELRLIRPDGGEMRVLEQLFGGQGTINVNSWAPDARAFAYMAYPVTH